MAQKTSLAAQARGFDALLTWLLLLSAGLLVLGWVLPIMTVEKLVFLSHSISILEAVMGLWEHDDLFLFAVIVIFSIVVPLLKLGFAAILWLCVDASNPDLAQWLAHIEILGKWSMLDVFVVALAVSAIQISLIDDVSLHSGIYVFTAAIVLSIAVVQRMAAVARRALRDT